MRAGFPIYYVLLSLPELEYLCCCFNRLHVVKVIIVKENILCFLVKSTAKFEQNEWFIDSQVGFSPIKYKM